MHDISIRPFCSADEAQVAALWNDVFHRDPAWNEPQAIIRCKSTVQPDLFFVAARGEQIVGTVLAGFDGVRGWIYHLAVATVHRRQGIATALMRAAEAALAELGCPKINLQVRADNQPVVAFYRALGYAVEERVSMGKRLGQ